MSKNMVFLKKWIIEGNFVKLLYSDNSVVRVKTDDFNRAFGAIINADKIDVIRDFLV